MSPPWNANHLKRFLVQALSSFFPITLILWLVESSSAWRGLLGWGGGPSPSLECLLPHSLLPPKVGPMTLGDQRPWESFGAQGPPSDLRLGPRLNSQTCLVSACGPGEGGRGEAGLQADLGAPSGDLTFLFSAFNFT